MATMPGEIQVDGEYDPGLEEKKLQTEAKKPYQPAMGAPKAEDFRAPADPYTAFLDDDKAAVGISNAEPGWKERFVSHFANAQRYGTPGMEQMGRARDAKVTRDILPDGSGGVMQQTTADAQADADYIASKRKDAEFQYEQMPAAETAMDYLAAIGGEIAGTAVDPISLLNPAVKVGTVGWRAANPVISRILESGVSNAAVNVAQNGVIQAQEEQVGLRDEWDWESMAMDAGVGFLFGAPFGIHDGYQAKTLYEQEAAAASPYANAPEPGKAPLAPGRTKQPTAGRRGTPPPQVPPEVAAGPATPETLMANHGREALDKAQEQLFGEVIGTRAMTPEQRNAVDDYLNGNKPGEIPQGKVETKGSAGPDLLKPAPPAPPAPNPPHLQDSIAPAPLGREYQLFSPSELKVDAKRFQFKEGGNDAGVTDRLKGVKKWDQSKSGVTLVWQDMAGNNFIADGHQRHGLATRLEGEGQQPKLMAMVLKESDGVTAEQARAIAAAKNIAEGTGNAVDAAKIFRGAPDMAVDLPPTSALVRDAQGLAKLSDDAFGMVINKKVQAGHAAIVGRLAPDPATHSDLLGMLAKNEPDNAIEAESMVRDALDAPQVQATMEDMFGSAEVTQILFKERAQILSSASTAIRKDRAAFTTLVKEESRIASAGNKLATATNAERASLDAEILANLQASARRKGPIADALAAAARALHDGTPRKDVVRDFLDILRGGTEADRKSGGRAGASGRTDEIAASLGGYRPTESPAFKRWFKESKIVDANGEPMVLYHGTDADFSVFSGLEIPGWFSTDPKHAEAYHSRSMEPGPAQTIPVYLSLQNPLDLSAFHSNWHVRAQDVFERAGLKVPEHYLTDRYSYAAWEIINTSEFMNAAKAAGYDGLVTKEGGDVWDNFDTAPGTITFAAFSPTQIKSIFNRGTWDAAEPNIAFSAPVGTHKGSAGPFQYWLVGSQKWEVRRNGKVLATVRNLSEASVKAQYFNNQLKAGDPHGILAEIDPPNEGIAFSSRGGPSLFDYEPGAEGKAQAVIPGTERIGDKKLAELKAKGPLRATRPQKEADFGLFGDTKDQLDLVDLSRIAPMVKHDADYVDLSPSGSSKSIVLGESSITYGVKDGEVEILSVRTPPQLRRQGNAREAMMAFLEKVDDAGLKVRAYAVPLDRMTHATGVIRFYESLGFTATGKKANKAGDIEMLREGPPPEIKELRSLVGSGRLVPLQDYRESGMARDVANAWYGSQPQRTLDDIYGGRAQRWQDELERVGRDIEDAIGIGFGNPGIKKRATTEEKMVRKGYRSTKQITDIVRAGFIAETPDQVQRAINMLAAQFHIIDEGWNLSDVSYFDRKVGVKFKDGTVGEIQFWQPDLLNAKSSKGHKLYKKARALPPGDPGRVEAELAQRELYEGVIAELDSDWLSAIGRSGSSGNVLENASRNASSPSNGLPESMTSAESTGVQSAPGSKTAQPNPASTTAGRSSQSKNRMAGSPSGQDMAFATGAQAQTMPTNRPQAGTPATAMPRGERLEAIGDDLAAITGAPVRQGRLARNPGSGKVMGQYDRSQGVIRLRVAADFDTQAHETAHSLETEYGRNLAAIKTAASSELEPLAYAGADPKQKLSEGFAEWFRFYVTTPAYAKRVAPKFTAEFEKLVDPAQLHKIQDVSARYTAWTQTPSGAAVSADIVSSRKQNLMSEAVTQMRREGVAPTIGTWFDKAYETSIDKLSPINRSIDMLMKVYEKNTGNALNITSAQDPYRLARLLQDSYAAGHIDAMHGVVPYHGTISEGPSLSDAIATALGKNWGGWDDDLMQDFAAYLVSRRAIHEYDRFLAGEIPNVPGKFTKGDYEVAVTDFETLHPEWAQAAQMVYGWQQNLLKKKFESGFITQDLYTELQGRPDYVPFMRDLTDLDKEGGAAPVGKTLRTSIVKAFRGSKRSVINPLESMLQDAYHFNALMKRNDVFKALEDLGRMAGPGGGSIVERIPSTALEATKVKVDEVLKSAAKAAGLNPNEVDHLTSFVDDMLGDDASGTVFKPGEINEKGEPIIYAWRDGKKHALRLADGDFGRDLYNSLTGMNKESHNLFVNVLALPSTVLRYSITTAPHFILANYIRDQVSAWVLAGDGFVPFISGAAGMRDELTQSEVSRIYNTFGGIMGGGNVASLDKGRAKRDINALNKKGYHVKRFAGIQGFAEFTGIAETGTRLGVFKNSFARARREGLSEYEAAVEAAYQARDYIDFGRHGSQTHTARRLVTFLNASLQGLDKTYRVLSGEGAIRKAITPYINHRAGRPLTARDKRNLGHAAKAWSKVATIGVFGLGLAVLYKDDPEYEEVSDYLKATHWMVKKGPGEWYAIPKPFELGFFSNLLEKGFDSVYNRNPIAMQSFLSGLYEVTMPPTAIPLFKTYYELAHNTKEGGQPIVGMDTAGLEPWQQYNGQTSAIAKNLGEATGMSPQMIDHALQGFGASWGKIIADGSTDIAEGKNPVETMANSVSRRFIRDVTRGATSTRGFWDLMSETSGPMTQAANTYKNLVENSSEAEASKMLEGRDDNTVAYALLTAHFDSKQERLHPMRRAQDALSVISKMKKEIAMGRFSPVEDDGEGEKIELSPSNKEMAQELLARLSMVEARNALITLQVPGWAQRDYMDADSIKEAIRLGLPQVADELEARYEKKKIYDEATVREDWPEVKNRVLTDRQDANFDDLTAGLD